MRVTGETVWQCFPCNVPGLAKAVNSVVTQHFVTAGLQQEDASQSIQARSSVSLFPPPPKHLEMGVLTHWCIPKFYCHTSFSLNGTSVLQEIDQISVGVTANPCSMLWWVKPWETLLLTQRASPLLWRCLQVPHKVKSAPDLAIGILRASQKGELDLVACLPSEVCSATLMCIGQCFDA